MSMPARTPRFARTVALLVAVIGALLAPSAAHAGQAGTVRFAEAAESSFDQYSFAPNTASQSWMRAHYWRLRTYAPYFDSRLSWFPNAWTYKDSYAIYTGERLATQHPDWILKDASGKQLYVQFACNGTTCPQYAADIGNPAFRADWIAKARAQMAPGYKGMFIDDVNMEPRVSDGTGATARPIDPRTGTAMTAAAWRSYLATFMAEVRSAFPDKELVHNALWYLGDTASDMQRQLNAADYVELERGVNDSGITGGTGQYSLRALFSFIDHRHAEGHGVVFDARATTLAGRLYGLASYFAVSSGGDALSNDPNGTPADWWSGYDVDLGDAQGARFDSAGVIRRNFTGGLVLVNEPGASTRTVTVGAGYKDLTGATVTQVTLGAASGAVLLRTGAPLPSGSAPATTTSPATPTTPTSTTVTTAPVKTTVPPATSTGPAKPSTGSGKTTTSPAPKSTSVRTKTHKTRKGIKVAGRVRGATVGTVSVLVQRHNGRRWVSARTVKATVSRSGRFNRVISGLRAGRYRVQARFAAAPPLKASASRFAGFRAR